MPDNNRKVLGYSMLTKLNAIYQFEYNKECDTIITKLSTCNRVTIHAADKPFLINSKRLKKKITFTLDEIDMWKYFLTDKKLAKYTLFDIHNTVNKLRVMYQQPTRKNVADMLLKDFSGIKKV